MDDKNREETKTLVVIDDCMDNKRAMPARVDEIFRKGRHLQVVVPLVVARGWLL